MRRVFVFDQEKCMGCNTCTVSCKDWNQVNPGPVRWRTQTTYEFNLNFYPLAMSCNHCAKPACLAACPAGAISKNADGIVLINRDFCQGFNTCVTACPFGAAQRADDKQEPTKETGWAISHPMQKCDFCIDRLAQNLEPICVSSCPAHALDQGDYNAMKAKYGAKLIPLSLSDFPYAFVNNKNSTEPSFFVIKRKEQIITKAVSR